MPAATRTEVAALASVILCSAGIYLLVLGAIALFVPAAAARFLSGFATAPRLHYLELGIRLLVGGALLMHAAAMPWSSAWFILGWVLIGTSALLIAIPWRWHRDFAARSVPRALRFITPMGLASGMFGCALLYATFAGPA